MKDVAAVGKRIRLLRNNQGMTQEELSEQALISRSSLKLYESGKLIPKRDTLVILAETLNCSVDYLLGETDTCFFLICRKCGMKFNSEKKTNFCNDCKAKRNGITENGGSSNFVNYGRSLDDYLRYKDLCEKLNKKSISYGVWQHQKECANNG